MFLIPKLKPKSLVGIDIDRDEIRLLQLRRQKGVLCVVNFAVEKLSKNAIQHGKIMDTEEVIRVLRFLAETTGTVGSPVAIALPAQSIISKRIHAKEGLTDAEFEVEFQSSLSDYLPGLTHEVCLDFVKLSSEKLLLVVAHQEQLKEYERVVSCAGFKPKIVEVDFLASARALFVANELCPPYAVLLVHSDSMQLLVFQTRDDWFQQSIPNKEDTFFSQQIKEVKLALQSFKLSYRHLDLRFLTLAGSSNQLSELSKKISKECEVSVVCANPFVAMSISAQVNAKKLLNHASSLLTVCGLALRGV